MKKSVKRYKKKFDIKKTILYKVLVGFVILLFVLLLMWVALKISEIKEAKELKGELREMGIFGEPFIQNCDDNSIKDFWDSIFYEPSINIIILKNETVNCSGYWAYKIINSEIYALSRIKIFLFSNIEVVVAYHINSSNSSILDVFNSYGWINISNAMDLDYFLIDHVSDVENRNLQDISEASSVYYAYFKPILTDWGYNNGTYIGNTTIKMEGSITAYGGGVLENKNVEIYEYIYMDIPFIFEKIAEFPNMSIYPSETKMLNLDDYFICSKNLTHSIINISDSIYDINLKNNELNITYNSTIPSYVEIFIKTSCGNESQINLLNINFINASINTPPIFNNTACGNLEWEVNTNYVLNMEKCWYDEGDNLTGFRYEDSSSDNENLSISKISNDLTLSPDTDWIGTGYFYIYASDGKNESRGKVDFEVVNSSAVSAASSTSGSSTTNTSTNLTNTTTANNPKIILSSPLDGDVYMFHENKTFSITAENYGAIKWYLNDILITEAEGMMSYEFVNLKEGDIVKVEVINGTRVDSKTWNIKIQEDEKIEQPVFDIGTVIFYLIITIICIIILLVIWLFIVEKNRGVKKNVGFGISGPESHVKVIGGRDSSLDSLNIPG